MPPLFDLIASGGAKVDQLLIEMHSPKSKETPSVLNNFFKAADKAKMRIFHMERNNWGCDGYRCVFFSLSFFCLALSFLNSSWSILLSSGVSSTHL